MPCGFPGARAAEIHCRIRDWKKAGFAGVVKPMEKPSNSSPDDWNLSSTLQERISPTRRRDSQPGDRRHSPV
jgi:hypothetical protein